MGKGQERRHCLGGNMGRILVKQLMNLLMFPVSAFPILLRPKSNVFDTRSSNAAAFRHLFLLCACTVSLMVALGTRLRPSSYV